MRTYSIDGIIKDIPYFLDESTEFGIQEMEGNQTTKRYVYPGDGLRYELDNELVDLYALFRNILFDDVDSYYKEMECIPIWVQQAGQDSDCAMSTEQFSKLVLRSDIPNLYRHLYLVDCQFLVGAVQNLLCAMEDSFINYYVTIASFYVNGDHCKNLIDSNGIFFVSSEEAIRASAYVWVYVPPTSTVEKCANRIYDRNEDGDMDITDSPIQLQNMYNRKSNTYAEHKIFQYVTTEDLRMDLMDKVRNLAKSKNPDHPWLKMSDEEILKSAGLWEKDFSSGIQGYNLAGVLLFGKDDVIRSCCPGYITDALYRVENLDRYDDRLQVTTNLIDAYDLLIEFVAKHTSDKFCLINNISTSIRGIISREVIGNILVHRDYSSAYPAKVIIEKDWLRTENWCIPRRHGNIMSDEFTPYPKNPLIQQFFANIGRTDTIGSGVRNLYKYTPMYSDGGKPELIEDDVFRINIPLDRIAADEATEQKTLSEREQKIYNMICENLHLSVEQVMAELDISRSTVFRDYAKIKKVTGAIYDKKTSTWTLQ